jgi:DNA-binding response OmpR family regulator
VKKVLAVHWQEEILRKIEQLAPPSWHVRSMRNGADAMHSTRVEEYDLIFCCLNLPVVTGIELVRSIRSVSINKSTPIIVLPDGAETEGQRMQIRKLQTVWLHPEDVITIANPSN